MLYVLFATISQRTFLVPSDTVLNITVVYTDVLGKTGLKHTREANLDYTVRSKTAGAA